MSDQLGFVPSLIIVAIGVTCFWGIQMYSNMKNANEGPNLMQGMEWIGRPLPSPVSHQILTRKNVSGASGMRIVGQFVKDEKILQSLSSHDLWEECSSKEQQWLDHDAQPSNIFEEVASKIWASHELHDNVAGYEYWCNILNEESTFGWHVDKSERAMSERRQLHSPLMGSVYYGYPHSNFYGGYLEIMQAHPFEEISPFYANAEIERIKPEYNRLVYLNVTEWHRVSDIRGEGKRYTFAVNLWREKPIDFE